MKVDVETKVKTMVIVNIDVKTKVDLPLIVKINVDNLQKLENKYRHAFTCKITITSTILHTETRHSRPQRKKSVVNNYFLLKY